MSMRDRLFVRQVRHLHPSLRDPRTAPVRRQIRRDFGPLAATFALHLPVPEALNAYWAVAREPTYGRRVDRPTKEAVAAAVSTTNQCPYCMDVHTTMLHALGKRAAATAVASGRPDRVEDPVLRPVVTWARATRDPDAAILRDRPFPDEHAPELIGIALGFHYINRMINIFGTSSPFPLVPAGALPFVARVASPALRRMVGRAVVPGESLELLPAAPLADDLGWARGDPVIADAFGRAAASFDAIGGRTLPDPVRQLVSDKLQAWRGEDPGLSRSWVDHAVEPLPAAQRPSGRLALLAAFASYQVDATILARARTRPGPAGDAPLVATAAWASFAATRRIGSWLHTNPATAADSRGPIG